ELPTVERALQLVAVHDLAAVPEVPAEVRAEGVVEVGDPVLVPPQHQVPAEVEAGQDLPRCQLIGPRDLEPAERDVERVAVGTGQRAGLLGRGAGGDPGRRRHLGHRVGTASANGGEDDTAVGMTADYRTGSISGGTRSGGTDDLV